MKNIKLLLVMSIGCGMPAATNRTDGTAVTAANEVKDVPAVDRARFPDSIGYLYQSDLATVFWMQNHLELPRIEDLQQRIELSMARGLDGEFLSTAMQTVNATGAAQPTLPEMMQQSAQSLLMLSQVAFVASDYGQSLADALQRYNADATRVQTVTDAAAHVETALDTLVASHTGGVPPPPPSTNLAVIKPGHYFADVIKSQEVSDLANAVQVMQSAIAQHDPASYEGAFSAVYYAQSNANLAKDAFAALSAHHDAGVLRGQPLDQVIQKYVRIPAAQPLSVEQMALVNRINLRSNDDAASREALVGAVLLVDLDHHQQEQDPTLSCPLIWDHIADTTWLVAQYVRLKADGTTAGQALVLIDSIVATI